MLDDERVMSSLVVRLLFCCDALLRACACASLSRLPFLPYDSAIQAIFVVLLREDGEVCSLMLLLYPSSSYGGHHCSSSASFSIRSSLIIHFTKRFIIHSYRM